MPALFIEAWLTYKDEATFKDGQPILDNYICLILRNRPGVCYAHMAKESSTLTAHEIAVYDSVETFLDHVEVDTKTEEGKLALSMISKITVQITGDSSEKLKKAVEPYKGELVRALTKGYILHEDALWCDPATDGKPLRLHLVILTDQQEQVLEKLDALVTSTNNGVVTLAIQAFDDEQKGMVVEVHEVCSSNAALAKHISSDGVQSAITYIKAIANEMQCIMYGDVLEETIGRLNGLGLNAKQGETYCGKLINPQYLSSYQK
ncbi:unnamed protein product [Owenia fusiformis]|uniref:Uncharacterized protein n=1 Tax=Owenia fusiformis TaxID=6347 RepID=A0A8J1XWG5_OWEFU|nr:unnamed protein product [Owenia fusiformis]